jgi:hypothetical protein
VFARCALAWFTARFLEMVNPDKLFDYLDGKLPDYERRDLEERLMDEPQLRRELDVARRIHAGMRARRSEIPEVYGELSEETAARGRRLTRQIAIAFSVLVAANVILGLLYIAHHEWKNPNRVALENQTREQLRHALDKAAANSLTPPPIGIGELTVTAESGGVETVVEEIMKLARRLSGTATKGVPDNGRIEVLAELPANRVAEFKNVVAIIGGVKSVGPTETVPIDASNQKVSILVQVTEAK